MIILHTYTEGDYDKQFWTMQRMVQISKTFPSTVESVMLLHPDSYWKTLMRHWGQETIITIERDIVPDVYQIVRLAACEDKAGACCHPYRLGDDRHSSLFEMLDGKMRFENPDDPPPYAFGSGLGLAKIELSTQRKIDLSMYPVDNYKWWYLDTWISERMAENGDCWHVHEPEVEHRDRP